MAELELAGTVQPNQENQENQEHGDNIASKTHNHKTHIRETVVSWLPTFMFLCFVLLMFLLFRPVRVAWLNSGAGHNGPTKSTTKKARKPMTHSERNRHNGT